MQIASRFIVLAFLAFLGWELYALSVNILILNGTITTETVSEQFGAEMTRKAVYVWAASIVPGIISIFIKEKWRYLLLICPLVTPAIFSILYTIGL